MKMSVLAVITMCLPFAISVVAAESLPPRFGLCKSIIGEVFIGQADYDVGNRRYVMSIQLNDEGKVLFASFTKKHLLENIEIVYDGMILGRNKVHSIIDSGLFAVNRWQDRELAGAVKALLESDRYDVQCGEVPSGRRNNAGDGDEDRK